MDQGSLLLQILRGHCFLFLSIHSQQPNGCLFHFPVFRGLILALRGFGLMQRSEGLSPVPSFGCRNKAAVMANAHTLRAASGSSAWLPLRSPLVFSFWPDEFSFLPYEVSHTFNISLKKYFIQYVIFLWVGIILQEH